MRYRTVAGKLRSAYDQLAHQLRQYETIVSHERAHVGISGEEFHSMAPKEWLGDACINMYIALLQVCCESCPRSNIVVNIVVLGFPLHVGGFLHFLSVGTCSMLCIALIRLLLGCRIATSGGFLMELRSAHAACS